MAKGKAPGTLLIFAFCLLPFDFPFTMLQRRQNANDKAHGYGSNGTDHAASFEIPAICRYQAVPNPSQHVFYVTPAAWRVSRDGASSAVTIVDRCRTPAA
jgi:hypothetical protein